MKRLNLETTWLLCLKMWKWIAMKVRAADKAGKNWHVNTLKREWCEKHSLAIAYEFASCFFCKWSSEHGGCCNCPARKIENEFGCHNNDYHHSENPIAFYKKLVSLNKKRLARKRSVK